MVSALLIPGQILNSPPESPVTQRFCLNLFFGDEDRVFLLTVMEKNSPRIRRAPYLVLIQDWITGSERRCVCVCLCTGVLKLHCKRADDNKSIVLLSCWCRLFAQSPIRHLLTEPTAKHQFVFLSLPASLHTFILLAEVTFERCRMVNTPHPLSGHTCPPTSWLNWSVEGHN